MQLWSIPHLDNSIDCSTGFQLIKGLKAWGTIRKGKNAADVNKTSLLKTDNPGFKKGNFMIIELIIKPAEKQKIVNNVKDTNTTPILFT